MWKSPVSLCIDNIEEYKEVRVREFMMVQDLSDPVVKNVMASRTWNARVEVNEMEEQL